MKYSMAQSRQIAIQARIDLIGWARKARTKSVPAENTPSTTAPSSRVAPTLLHGASATVHAAPATQANSEVINSQLEATRRRLEVTLSILKGPNREPGGRCREPRDVTATRRGHGW